MCWKWKTLTGRKNQEILIIFINPEAWINRRIHQTTWNNEHLLKPVNEWKSTSWFRSSPPLLPLFVLKKTNTHSSVEPSSVLTAWAAARPPAGQLIRRNQSRIDHCEMINNQSRSVLGGIQQCSKLLLFTANVPSPTCNDEYTRIQYMI